MNKWWRIAGWIVVGLTAVFFLQSGIQKLMGTEQMVRHFEDLGLPGWSRTVIGLVELAGAILLALPRLTLYAALALGGLMVGATATELWAGQGAGALLPGQWLILLAIIAGVRYKVAVRRKTGSRADR